MRRGRAHGRSERGSTLVEFTIGALVFLTAIFGVLEFSRLLFTHNALSDSVRRAARYAVSHASADETAVKNIAVNGNAEGTGQPVATNLTTANADIVGVGLGRHRAYLAPAQANFFFKKARTWDRPRRMPVCCSMASRAARAERGGCGRK